MSHFLARIWAILLGFGLFGRIRVSIGPKGDEALRMEQGGRMDVCTDIQMDGQIPPVFFLVYFGPFKKKSI